MRSSSRLPHRAVRVKHPMSPARCEETPAQTTAPSLGPARRDIPPGSCRRRGPGSKPPCAGWRAGSSRSERASRCRCDPGKCSGTARRGRRISRQEPRSLAAARIVLSRRWVRKNPRSNAGVAGVGAFEVEQNQPVLVHQDVLGAEVAEDERSLVFRDLHRGDERIRPAVSGRGGPGRSSGSRGRREARRRGWCRRGCPRASGCPGALSWISARMIPNRAAISGSTSPAISCDFQVTASSGAQVIAKR